MGFPLSPIVQVFEFDKTLSVPAVATSIAAMVGDFEWGPTNEVTLAESEQKLQEIFGSPNDTNYKDWFSAANFLAYSNNLKVVRAVGALAVNAVSENVADAGDGTPVLAAASITATALSLGNRDEYDQEASFTANVPFYAKYQGTFGNSIKVDVLNGAYETWAAAQSAWGDSTLYSAGDYVTDANKVWVTAAGGTSSGTGVDDDTGVTDWAEIGPDGFANWTFQGEFDAAPLADDIYIVVTYNGTIVETFLGSQDNTATGASGGTAWYVELVNRSSRYLWAAPVAANTGLSFQNDGATASLAYSGTLTAGHTVTPVYFTQTLEDGVNDSPTDADVQLAWLNKFVDGNSVDVNFALQAGGSTANGKYILENIAMARKDCVAVMSPDEASVVGVPAPEATVAALRAAGEDFATSSSYGVIDGNYKKQYDKYNDVYRWVPFNGDVAGLMANTDNVRDPWWSPAGLNRGFIKNVTAVAFNPSQTQMDELYRVGINPIVQFAGEGTVLYGDKTAQTRPSAFDRINVRRLFITLEKAISTAAKYKLFEFNDEITRAEFVNLVEPFLRDVQGRRGVTDYRVVCDETNNTGEVIDRNEFIADIYIKPNRAINFIKLNFVAVKTGVSFEEVVLTGNTA